MTDIDSSIIVICTFIFSAVFSYVLIMMCAYVCCMYREVDCNNLQQIRLVDEHIFEDVLKCHMEK